MRTDFKVLLIILAILSGCNDSKKVNVLFSNVDGLKSNSTVYLESIVVGVISEMNVRKDGKVVVTLDIDSEFELPKSSIIQYQVDFLGNSYIEFISTNETSEFERPQEGNQITFDSLTYRKLSKHEVDSILKGNPDGKIIDTVLRLMESISSRKQNIDALDRKGTLLTE